jgi:molybdopterin synthase catalytic subunit
MTMSTEIRDTEFDPCAELHRYEEEILSGGGKFGATVSFVGTMRDFNDSESVHAMTLEHYPGMTETHLDRILEEARRRWDILDALIIHRVGELNPNDPIVLVAVWSAHRAPAFDACRYLIEELKTRAPFWKKEQRPQGARWVEHNTPAAGKTH